ncbi:MAG: glycosyltransferase family 61 protein [Alphaproteobacteria bacterium]|nr:glycosyltransferase family 61 protein [Alphaproteobacteria bacterium]
MTLRSLEAVDLAEICQRVDTAQGLLAARRNSVLDLLPATEVELAPAEFGDPEDVASLGVDETEFCYQVVDRVGRAEPFQLAKLFGARLRNGCHALMARPGLVVGESYHKRDFLLRLEGPPRGFFPIPVPLRVNGVETSFVTNVYDDEEPDQILPGPVVAITSRWASNYYHWMLDCVPRLACLDLVPELRGVPILVPPEGPRFQAEILAALGFTETVAFTGRVLSAEVMYFPSFFSPGLISRGQIEWLKTTMFRAFDVTPPERPSRRLFISRKGAGARRIVNEDDAMAMLARHGFEAVLPETLSLRDQVALFASAEMVIAPSGSGTVNAAYCRRGTTVIDVVPENSKHSAFWLLARANGMRYGRLVAKPVNLPASDMALDLVKLDAIVRQAAG